MDKKQFINDVLTDIRYTVETYRYGTQNCKIVVSHNLYLMIMSEVKGVIKNGVFSQALFGVTIEVVDTDDFRFYIATKWKCFNKRTETIKVDIFEEVTK